jgi:hypothetical protein
LRHDLPDGLIGRVGDDVDDSDRRTRAREGKPAGPAQGTPGARDECPLARQLSRHEGTWLAKP